MRRTYYFSLWHSTFKWTFCVLCSGLTLDLLGHNAQCAHIQTQTQYTNTVYANREAICCRELLRPVQIIAFSIHSSGGWEFRICVCARFHHHRFVYMPAMPNMFSFKFQVCVILRSWINVVYYDYIDAWSGVEERARETGRARTKRMEFWLLSILKMPLGTSLTQTFAQIKWSLCANRGVRCQSRKHKRPILSIRSRYLWIYIA